MNALTRSIPPLRKIRSLFLLASIAASAQVAPAATTYVWNGANFSTATTNWSDAANWLPTGSPGSADTAVFGANGIVSDALTVNNALTANTTVTGLQYTNTTAATWHVTQIPAGVTLTVTGTTVVGGATANGLTTSAAFVDAGTLVLSGSLNIGNNGSSSADQHTILDLSGLTNFVYNSSSAINLGIGNRSAADFKLASGSNNITANVLNANGGSTSSGVSGTLTLGGGTNIINVNLFTNGASRGNGTVTFPNGVTGAGLRVRGAAGGDNDRVATLMMGNRNQNTSGGTDNGTFNFNGNAVDMKFGTMILGQAAASGPSGTQTGGGIINFDTGIIDATTINMAISSANAFNVATGLVNVGTSAMLVVSNFSLVNQGALGTSTGSLNVNGGTVNCSGNIFKTSTAGTANINVASGGTINMTSGGNIGFTTNAIDNVTLTDSKLTLAANLTPAIYATNLTAGGSANTINVTAVPPFFAYPAQFPLISYVNALGDNNTFTVGTLPGTYSGYISNNASGLSIDVVITNGPALAVLKSIRWSGTPTGDWTTNVGVLNWLTNSTAVNYNQGDTVTFDDTLTGTTNVNLTMTLTPTAMTVNNSAVSYAFTGVGKLSGVTGLTKTGTGTLIIDNSGDNDFAGGVTISAGTVQVGNNDTNGNLPTTGAWDDEGTLAFSRSDNLVLSQVISGAGSLVQNGNGKLTLSSAQTYTGSTIVSKGTLALVPSGSIASTSGVLAQGGTFDVSGADPAVSLNIVNANGGGLTVGTNSVAMTTLGLTNSTLTVVANFNNSQSISVNNLAVGGTTNVINVTAVQNVPDGQALPIVIPIIRYSTTPFSGVFNIGETNFPNAFISNDVQNATIDLVLTQTPYTITWNGGSATGNNWSDSANWNGQTIFPGDNLFFDGTTRLTPLNDLAANSIISGIIFNATAGAFTLTGNPVLFSGVTNNSAVAQTILMPLDFSGNAALNGATAPLIIGGGLTNVSSATGSRTLTLMGTGILTNLFGSTTVVGGTNGLILNDSAANWTLLDNATSTRTVAPWAFELNNGTFNFGSASSAPQVISTSPQGVPSDNQLGNSATAVLNFSNGVYTTSARFNTGGGSGSGTINQYNGLINIASQFQGANGSASATSAVNLFGGTMNIGVSPNSTNSSLLTTNFGTFYVSSRGNASLTITNSALLNCGTLDVERVINGGVTGTVNLDGGTIVANSVSTATANQVAANSSTANFYFNGGTLKARANSATFFQGRTTAPITPINAYVTARGAFIDSDVYAISFLEPLLTDPNLGGAQDGGLTKLGTGTLTLAGTNTYFGDTHVNAGTLLVTGQGVSAAIVATGATLGGNGVIGSNVTVNAGGTLAPGNIGVGTLTVGGNVSLAGTTTVDVDKTSGLNDLVEATNVTATTITYGGTLNVAATNGSLTAGDTFKLFDATNYVGAFTTINPANVVWDTSSLNANGTLKVVSVTPPGPTTNASITKVTLSGANLLVHGTNNNVPNNIGNFVVLTSTNIASPLSQWTPVSTNSYNSDGTFDTSVPVVPGTPQQFIDVKAQ